MITARKYRLYPNKAQKIKFKGEFFPFSSIANPPITTFFEFFQIDKHTGNPKGIVGLKL
jgi:hypothetical protein